MLGLDLPTFVFQIINFLILLAIMTRFFYKPVLALMARRQAEIDARLADAAERARQADEERRNLEEQTKSVAAQRKSMVGSGDRSDKIRTYNFPQNRVSDHRIGLTLHQLGEVMDGRLQPMIDALVTHFQAEKLKQETATVG